MLISKIEMLQVGASYCYTLQPDTQRVVIVQSLEEGTITTTGARFQNGKWIDVRTGSRLSLPITAVWCEAMVFDPSEQANVENQSEEMPLAFA